MSFNRPPDAKHQEEGGGKYCILCSLQEASSYKCGQAYNLGIFLLSFFSFFGDCGADNIFEPLVSHKNTVYTCGVSIRSSLMPKWRLQRFKQNVPDSTLTDTDSMSVNFPLFSFFLSPSASVWGVSTSDQWTCHLLLCDPSKDVTVNARVDLAVSGDCRCARLVNVEGDMSTLFSEAACLSAFT